MDTRTTMRRLAWIMLVTGSAFPVIGQETSPSQAASSATPASFPVSSIQVHFVRDNPANPAGYALMDVPVTLSPVGDGFGPDDDSGHATQITLGEFATRGNIRLTDQGLATLAPALLRRLKSMGYVGVYVTPDPSQFRVEGGNVVDTRAAGDTSLTLLVTLGVVTKVQTSAVGDRFDAETDQLIDNPKHQWIRDFSPVKATSDGPPGSDIIAQDAIDNYTFRLNRQPGRRVDVSVATPGETPGDVQLNYVVTENRPWLLFAQVSNNGSASTSHWREHFGFVHNNLTNADDVLTIDYQTANFSEVHSIAASYERPIEVLDRVRWKLDGSWYSYRASDLGQQDVNFRGEGWDLGAHVIWNFFQERDLFLDLLAGVRYKNLRVTNDAAFVSGHNQFFEPDVAIRLERHRDASRTDAQLTASFNIPGVATDASTIDALGRSNADDDFAILRLDASHSFFLDPLFRADGEAGGGLVHELSFQVHGQESFGARLIPNEEDIA
ncbi:MAG: ShlB/FhaC/HecB family hemolysin secretion/activation protein, partial [Phycisphaerales bacterium]